MSCECAQCRQHYRTLGIAFGIPEESAIEEAYREGVKQWHPDLYENYASLRADAEEHFKQIQIAFRELKEHNASMAGSPVEGVVVRQAAVERVDIQPEEEAPATTSHAAPAISFGDAPGCLVASQFTDEVKEIIESHMAKSDTPLAIIDLNGARSRANYSHFFLLTNRGIMVRDLRNTVSALWYKDIGQIIFVDKGNAGKSVFWQQISGGGAKRSLEIYRSNGTHFFSIPDAVDDNVKGILYNFLSVQKL
ncbi:MAG: J domain-containing protein [Terracidiphilus sp.]|jgi:hypothetical protein